jgi:hypothetical protein
VEITNALRAIHYTLVIVERVAQSRRSRTPTVIMCRSERTFGRVDPLPETPKVSVFLNGEEDRKARGESAICWLFPCKALFTAKHKNGQSEQPQNLTNSVFCGENKYMGPCLSKGFVFEI